MGGRLFGTDGVRGIANVEPMTSETALRLGRALAHVSKRSPHRHKILIGKDTRLSGYMLETAMASGICSMGVDVLLVGPLPTPGIAFLTRTLRADAGVVISASHNPFQDNGIKFFSRTGFKLPDEIEAEIERLVLSDSIDALRPTATAIGKAFRIDDAVGRYNVFVKNTFPRHLTLDGFKVVIDCGQGAAYRVAPEVLEELGARIIAQGVDPDGENINQDCGALYPELLQETVRRTRANLGIALDGDADRAIFVDEKGEVVDGDEVMAMCATALDERGELRERTLVATVMSNLGLHLAMRARGVCQRLACSSRFRRPVSGRSTTGSWKTTLETLRAPSGSVATSWPARRAEPLVGITVVVSIPIVVDLPAPFGPSRANTSPGSTVKETPRTASTPPGYVFVRWSTSIIVPPVTSRSFGSST